MLIVGLNLDVEQTNLCSIQTQCLYLTVTSELITDCMNSAKVGVSLYLFAWATTRGSSGFLYVDIIFRP